MYEKSLIDNAESPFQYKIKISCDGDSIHYDYIDLQPSSIILVISRTHIIKRFFQFNNGTTISNKVPIPYEKISTNYTIALHYWILDIIGFHPVPSGTLSNESIYNFLYKCIGKEVTIEEDCLIPIK
jgi:hypothetical protein